MLVFSGEVLTREEENTQNFSGESAKTKFWEQNVKKNTY